MHAYVRLVAISLLCVFCASMTCSSSLRIVASLETVHVQFNTSSGVLCQRVCLDCGQGGDVCTVSSYCYGAVMGAAVTFSSLTLPQRPAVRFLDSSSLASFSDIQNPWVLAAEGRVPGAFWLVVDGDALAQRASSTGDVTITLQPRVSAVPQLLGCPNVSSLIFPSNHFELSTDLDGVGPWPPGDDSLCVWRIECLLPLSHRWDVSPCTSSLQSVTTSCNQTSVRGYMEVVFRAPYAPIVGGLVTNMSCGSISTWSASHSASGGLSSSSSRTILQDSRTTSLPVTISSTFDDSRSVLRASDSASQASSESHDAMSLSSTTTPSQSLTTTTPQCSVTSELHHYTNDTESINTSFRVTQPCVWWLNLSTLSCNSSTATITATSTSDISLCVVAIDSHTSLPSCLSLLHNETSNSSLTVNTTANISLQFSFAATPIISNVSVTAVCTHTLPPHLHSEDNTLSTGIIVTLIVVGAGMICGGALTAWSWMDQRPHSRRPTDATDIDAPLIEEPIRHHDDGHRDGHREGIELWYDHADDIRALMLRDKIHELRADASDGEADL
ncbi:membrane-associated protein, putative [Bodo saltans]|uniref:Membrane-associated protein, putative n=1 Tax=Bodo saltans TaxID=75058 RepID=A0A0S4J417_BODSA|nr:membrane-associated protein, putative [Bodo saltans]|eukprot:CUG81245.1 membrane-associated protein, putative [Bodo saltans]